MYLEPLSRSKQLKYGLPDSLDAILQPTAAIQKGKEEIALSLTLYCTFKI